VFGGDDLDGAFADQYWRDVEDARNAIRSTVTLKERVRADLSLDSIRSNREGASR
jgi:hypothetical protein